MKYLWKKWNCGRPHSVLQSQNVPGRQSLGQRGTLGFIAFPGRLWSSETRSPCRGRGCGVLQGNIGSHWFWQELRPCCQPGSSPFQGWTEFLREKAKKGGRGVCRREEEGYFKMQLHGGICAAILILVQLPAFKGFQCDGWGLLQCYQGGPRKTGVQMEQDCLRVNFWSWAISTWTYVILFL